MSVDVAAMPRGGAPFAPYHKWDRNFFLLWVLLIWVGIIMGFGGDIVHHVEMKQPAFPLIVHFHAVAFVGWMLVLTTQTILVRRQQLALHMMLGSTAVALAAVMVVLGPITAIIVQRSHFGIPDGDPTHLPQFLAIQLGDIVGFTGLVTAAFALRTTPSAHKRLILLATLFISDAGFARWLGDGLNAVLGSDTFWGSFGVAFLPNDVLILGIGVYDLITRRRLHPAYIAGVLWAFAVQLVANWLLLDPGWKTVATHLIGH